MSKTGLNTRCLCGSGKKFKKCCLPGRKTKPLQKRRLLSISSLMMAHPAAIESWASQYGSGRKPR